MLSWPDFKEKKLVYVANFGNNPDDLKFSNDNIVLYKDGKKVSMISCHIVFGLFLIGDMTITSVLIRKATQYGISIFLLDNSLRCYATINSKAEGNYLLRDMQYKMDNDSELRLTKWIVKNKLENQYKLMNGLGNKGMKGLLNSSVWNLNLAKSMDAARGIEGNFSKVYFDKVFGEIGWYRRAPQTKEDVINLLLDMGYTFLFNFVDAILNIFGFDTYKGFYHRLFFQRKSLSCDLMEPMRAIIDKKIVKAYNLGQVCEKDFGFKNGVYFFKKYDYRKKYAELFLEAINENKELIYRFIEKYYRHLHKPDVYDLPLFKLK